MADLFCGAGGTSTGAIEAGQWLGYRVDVTGVNHWNRATETFLANHPGARVLCTGVDDVRPQSLFGEGELDLLWASPECMHHSVARGGRPINDQSRATAWCVVRWAEALRPGIILVENVPEFQGWGPIGANGRPLKSKKGETFRAWLAALASLNYRVEYRVLCAADYGDPTTRRRLFVQAVRGRRRIVWPEATHGPSDLLRQLHPHRSAREHVVDWSLKGRWIDEMKPQARYGGLPLSPNSLERINSGFLKHGLKRVASGVKIAPYITTMEHGGSVRSIDRPMPTVTTAKGGAISLVMPYLVTHRGTSERHLHSSAGSIDEPVSTVAGEGGHIALAEPFLFYTNHPGGDRTLSVDDPLPTVAGNRGEIAMVQAALLEPYLVEYYGTGGSQSVDDPLNTVTSKHRHALVSPEVVVDGRVYRVRYRMLQAHELAAAQGFTKDYQFSGTKTEQVKQIGNAVPRRLARALVAAVLAQDSGVNFPMEAGSK